MKINPDSIEFESVEEALRYSHQGDCEEDCRAGLASNDFTVIPLAKARAFVKEYGVDTEEPYLYTLWIAAGNCVDSGELEVYLV